MFRRLLLGLSVLCFALPAAASTGFARLPLAFEPNDGRTDHRVRFVARGPGYELFLTGEEAVIALNADRSASALRMRLAGANPAPLALAERRLPSSTHHFSGDGRNAFRSSIPHFGAVRFSGVYDGVDLLYYGNGRELEYDFVVAPFADTSRIAIDIKGAGSIALAEDGSLLVTLGGRTLRWSPPIAYQQIGRVRVPVEAKYALAGDRIEFRLGDYDRAHTLVIDPKLVYSTYFGGSASENVADVAVDVHGNMYLAGRIHSFDFPGLNGRQVVQSAAFVSKLDASGNLLFTSVLDGTQNEQASAVAVDNDGNIFLAGETNSRDFPLVRPLRSKLNGGHLFRRTQDTNWQDVPTSFEFIRFVPDVSSTTIYAVDAYTGPIRSDDAGLSWSKVNSPYVGYISDVATGPGGALYFNARCDGNGVSRDGGATWAFFPRADPYRCNTNFSASPTVPGVVLTGGNTIFRSVNDGSAWTIVAVLGKEEYLTATGWHPTQSGVVYGASVGYSDTGSAAYFYRSTDAGLTWSRVATLPRQFQQLKVSASGTILLREPRSVLRSTDNGSTWSEVSGLGGELLDMSVTRAGVYYVASDSGVFISTNECANWAAWTSGLDDKRTRAVGASHDNAFVLTSTSVYDPDIFLARLSPDGSTLAYSTLHGGERDEAVTDLALYGSRAYVTGYTTSESFVTTPGVVQPKVDTHCYPYHGCRQGFVAAMNETGSAWLYSTYLGPSNTMAKGVAVDSSGNAYLTGDTTSSFFPHNNLYGCSGTACSSQGWVVKLNATGTSRLYSTILGGRAQDSAEGIAIDASNNAIVVGNTRSSDFPVAGAMQSTLKSASGNGFAMKLNASGQRLWATYLGGSGGTSCERTSCSPMGDNLNSVTVDAAGNAWITGSASSPDYPWKDALYSFNSTTCYTQYGSYSCGDAVLTALDRNGALHFSTPFGGSGAESGYSIAVDPLARQVVIGGATSSADLPITPSAYDAVYSGHTWEYDTDGFAAKFAISGTPLDAPVCPTVPDSVNICEPAAGASVGSPVRVRASAAGAQPIVHTKIYLDSREVYASNSFTIDTALAVGAGAHTLVVQSWDVAGAVYKATRSVNVGGAPPACSSTAIGVVICAPAQGSTVSSPVTISAAAKGYSTIVAMRAYLNGRLVASSSNATLSAASETSAGTYQLVVNAWDSVGRLYQAKSSFSVGSGTPPPQTCTASTQNYSVTICSPLAGATVASPVRFRALTTSSDPVVHMKIYVDYKEVYSIYGSAIDVSLPVAAGTHNLIIQSWTNRGLVARSTSTFRVQ